MEIEGSIENVDTPGQLGAGQYMALAEITRSQRTGTEASPYLEINEYAPLQPRTRSWEVPRENVTIEKVIGKGAFGQVAQGKASHLRGREETVTVAIKMLKGATFIDYLGVYPQSKELIPHYSLCNA